MTSIVPLALPEVLLITPKRHGDARGWFAETWSRKSLAGAGIDCDFVQDNQAYNAKTGTVRGLHFQTAPHAQAKLVRVLKGAIYDVAVDVRQGSATFGRWVGAKLTAEGGEQLFVPRGFAHGYCTLTDDCELFYKVDGLYAPQCEGGVIWNDPDLAIDWPVAADEAVTSEKDKALPRLKDMPEASF
ncbi:dTDP-4-dehydrorhamnose 3,5-epimerase [Phenylobacterium sp.]|uniref:dTDP-4-dehydrorhamnose 3,5-epimerase n=2 Tax=Phenylobacterium sp. TaxID=1871053 RepID=UPI0017C88E60|nr:dTDP-4-dehydrorhamnose 3,5-epimerase [Phenylobacterium sp.]MBA4793689.1 dTDP-4-dehydrorhamnose 3,5-epimerase [Phenylobacterium sp.]MBC7168666.1 dTDP-4-dehydrorhamnose 3,5-epimerase [Phenylobacterium sp.]